MASGPRFVKFTDRNSGEVRLGIVTDQTLIGRVTSDGVNEGGEGTSGQTLIWRVPLADVAAVPAGSDASSADGTFEEIG